MSMSERSQVSLLLVKPFSGSEDILSKKQPTHSEAHDHFKTNLNGKKRKKKQSVNNWVAEHDRALNTKSAPPGSTHSLITAGKSKSSGTTSLCQQHCLAPKGGTQSTGRRKEQGGRNPLPIVRLAGFEQQDLSQSWDSFSPLSASIQQKNHLGTSSLQADSSPLWKPSDSHWKNFHPSSLSWSMVCAPEIHLLFMISGPALHLCLWWNPAEISSTSESTSGKSGRKCFNRRVKSTLKIHIFPQF